MHRVAFAALKLLEMLEKHVSSAARMPPVSATVVGQVIALLRVRRPVCTCDG